MAKTQRHRKRVAKKANTTRQKRKEQPIQWTATPAWRTRSQPAATIQTIIDTYELLESILEYLPARDIVVCERVCFKARSTIKQSSILQQKLFSRPDYSNQKLWTAQLSYNVDSNWNEVPILAGQIHVSDHDGMSHLVQPGPPNIGPIYCQPKVVNPMLMQHFIYGNTVGSPLYRRIAETNFYASDTHNFFYTTIDILKAQASHAESSPRKMQLTRPPTHHIEIRRPGSYSISCSRKDRPLIFDDVFEAVRNRMLLWGPEPLLIEILDGLGVTEAEKEVVEFGDQDDLFRSWDTHYEVAHTNPNFNKIYPMVLTWGADPRYGVATTEDYEKQALVRVREHQDWMDEWMDRSKSLRWWD